MTSHSVRVLVDALPLRQGGGVVYLQSQLKALARNFPQYSLHTLRSPWSQLTGLPGVTETVKVGSVATRYAYEQLALWRRKADALYCPGNFGPAALGPPTVLALHNANYFGSGRVIPESAANRPWWKVRACYAAMRRADIIVATSAALADEVLSSAAWAAPKLRVVLSGAPDWPDAALELPGLPPRYALTVASAAAHKRVDDVVGGWALAVQGSRDPVPLVVVGGVGPEQKRRNELAAGAARRSLLHIGDVSDRRQMKWLYAHANVMIGMSVLEAFPLTPAEAGAVGCPLILSDIPPHREVTVENATFVPARDVDALAEALRGGALTETPGSRHWLWPVTWDDNARALEALIREVA